MPRLQDILFGVFGVSLVVMLMFHINVGVLALVGAFACGAIYLLAGMWPAQSEPLGSRLFTAAFLAVVLSCIVLIVPGTFGEPGPEMQEPVVVIAGLLPLAAVCFELIRTPRVIHAILRGLQRVLGPR